MFAGFCLAGAPARADVESALVLTPDTLAGQPIGRHVDVLEDATGLLELSDVQQPQYAQQFKRSRSPTLGFGLTKSAYWLRFKVENPEPVALDWMLELSYPPLDDIRMYVPHGDMGMEERRTGDHLPFASREVLDPGTAEYFVRVCTTGSLSVPLRAWSARRFIEHLSIEHPPLWIFYGLMLVMAVYNLFVFASVRDRAYLYYVCYIVSYIGLQFSLNGFAFEYLWPHSIWWNSRSLLIWLYFGILVLRLARCFSGNFCGCGSAFRGSTVSLWAWVWVGSCSARARLSSPMRSRSGCSWSGACWKSA
jgi:two-component system, sensor histidine kinase LadS